MARKNNTLEDFGNLAAKYSIEPEQPGTCSGEVPPIRKYGGQPVLEEEAFSLKPGELSGVMQDGRQVRDPATARAYTKPAEVEFARGPRHDLRRRARRSSGWRCRIVSNDCRRLATIDNYLAGTSRSPKQQHAPSPTPNVPSLRQVPGG